MPSSNLNRQVRWLYAVQNGEKNLWLYREILFMNSNIKFLHIEWRTPYPLTAFEDRLGLRASVIFFLL